MSKPKKIQQPKKQAAGPTHERRFLGNGELRVQSDDSGKKIVGYAAKFSPALSADLGGWREQLDPHCFDRCLASSPDVRALWNHDANHVLGRTTSGTLRIAVDSIGLRYEIDPPDTQLAKDLMVSMSRKDVTQSSFGFICSRDHWSEDSSGILRTVLEAELMDVSPVAFPAYPDATSGVRADLRSCPANLRSKLKRDDDDDLDEDDSDNDDDGEQKVCPECGQPLPPPDEDDDDEERQAHAAHLELLTRRLRS